MYLFYKRVEFELDWSHAGQKNASNAWRKLMTRGNNR